MDLSAQHTSFHEAATQVILVFRCSDSIGPFYLILTPFSINITYQGWVKAFKTQLQNANACF